MSDNISEADCLNVGVDYTDECLYGSRVTHVNEGPRATWAIIEAYSQKPDLLTVRFDGKPEKKVRVTLRRHGFRWDDYHNCWVYRGKNIEAEAERISAYLWLRARLKVETRKRFT